MARYISNRIILPSSGLKSRLWAPQTDHFLFLMQSHSQGKSTNIYTVNTETHLRSRINIREWHRSLDKRTIHMNKKSSENQKPWFPCVTDI